MLATTVSATQAASLKSALYKKKIKARIVQTPTALAGNGCGYSVFFPKEALPAVMDEIQKNGRRVRAVWEETGVKDDPYRKIFG